MRVLCMNCAYINLLLHMREYYLWTSKKSINLWHKGTVTPYLKHCAMRHTGSVGIHLHDFNTRGKWAVSFMPCFTGKDKVPGTQWKEDEMCMKAFRKMWQRGKQWREGKCLVSWFYGLAIWFLPSLTTQYWIVNIFLAFKLKVRK